ncbi:MAG: ferredoxin [Oscillospiraceae bacterium]|nr:ferredoxin [Oscillospiraceae bacterium]
MKAFVDKNSCISCGICASVCPVVFAMSDDGKAEAVLTDVPEGSMDNAKNAEKSCPTDAVMLEY